MATRATYVLPAAGSNQNICFYIHYDGYLTGAAHYFYHMQQCKNMRSGLAGRFFRANAQAEFTTCHEEHADTEFRYAINQQDALTVWQKDTLNDEWRTVYHDFWYQFVVRHEALYQLGVKVLAEKPNLWLSVSSFELMEVTT
ncbi:MAG: hypothetical protein KBD83_08835 [Gammaproteobacteria bacterium]|nr:hypothetical protein [Gammaproteobacteria bacterium]